MVDYSAFVDECGGLQAAADALGISYDAMRLRRSKQRRKAERGELGFDPVLPGYAIKSIASKSDGKWIKQTKAPGERFEMPPGQTLKRVSALVDGDDLVINKWILTDRDREAAAAMADMIRASFNDFVSRHEPLPEPDHCNDDLLTDYVVGDHHLGLLSWKPETGENFDTKIGERLLISKMDELVARTPPSKTAIFTNLGDFFHSNNSRNRTEESDNALDVDGRYGKVIRVGLHLAASCIERLLSKHQRVIVCWLQGNHDPNVAMSAALGLWAWFRDNPRVEIKFDPSLFFVHQHGKTLLFATHGHALKPADVVPFVTGKYRELWGITDHCYAKFGHVHHKTSDTIGDLMWESFETLAANDAWHAGRGYRPGKSGRSMTAITYHNVTGEWSRNRVSV